MAARTHLRRLGGLGARLRRSWRARCPAWPRARAPCPNRARRCWPPSRPPTKRAAASSACSSSPTCGATRTRASARTPRARAAPPASRCATPRRSAGSSPRCWRSSPNGWPRWSRPSPAWRLYAHFFDNIHRGRAHTLPADQEALLAGAGLMARGAGQVFNAFDNADLQLGEVTDEEGRRVTLTKARHQKFMKSPDRRVRQESYEMFLDAYGAMQNTLAANLDANVKNHVFFAQARRHEGTLEAALHPDGVPPAVFHALVETVGAHTGRHAPLHGAEEARAAAGPAARARPGGAAVRRRRIQLRATTTPARCCCEAFAPLGADVRRRRCAAASSGGWIDVHENAGKRSGGYSSGSYDTAPYILLNWSGQLGDTFTLAHELGHSLHTWLASRHQPYVYGDYPDLHGRGGLDLQRAADDGPPAAHDHRPAPAALPAGLPPVADQQHGLPADDVRRVRAAHPPAGRTGRNPDGRVAERPLPGAAGQVLGPRSGVRPRPAARSPGAASRTSSTTSTSTSTPRRTRRPWPCRARCWRGGADDREQYLDILRSGCSRYPVETVRLGGVDLASPGPMQDVITLFGELVDQVESLLES